MAFSQAIADEVFVRCGRHCCLCGVFAGQKMELHHIKQAADGGEDSIENCIPLCLNCHAEVKAYNPKHPKGRKYTETELKGHRDKYFAQYSTIASPPVAVDAKDTFIDWFDRSSEDIRSPITWGYLDLNTALPLRPGCVVLVAGYTGAGKSIFAQGVVRENLKRKNTAVYFNLKESSEIVLNNMIAAESAIAVGNIHRNQLTAEEWQRLSLATGILNITNLKFVPYNPDVSIQEQLIATVRNSQAQIVVVDDIGGLGLRDDSEIESFMYKLKGAASASETVVFLLSNLTLKTFRFDDRPVLSDFATDSVYRFCDIVQFIYRDHWDDDFSSSLQKVEVITAKSMVSTKPITVILAALRDYPVMCNYKNRTLD